MAASLKNISRPLSRLLLHEKHVISVVCTRSKVYDSQFVETTKSYETIKEPVPEDDLRRFRKIKAAHTDDNTFGDYDPVVQKFINMVLKQGKKALARDLVIKALMHVKHAQVEKYHKAPTEEKSQVELDPVKILYQALENGKPRLMTMKVRSGGQAHLVPIAATEHRQNFLTMKWLIEAAKEKPAQMRFYEKLGIEILNAYKQEGGLIRRKQELHKLCEANKSLAHLR